MNPRDPVRAPPGPRWRDHDRRPVRLAQRRSSRSRDGAHVGALDPRSSPMRSSTAIGASRCEPPPEHGLRLSADRGPGPIAPYIGAVGLSPPDDLAALGTVEVGWRLARALVGQRVYATVATREALRPGFDSRARRGRLDHRPGERAVGRAINRLGLRHARRAFDHPLVDPVATREECGRACIECGLADCLPLAVGGERRPTVSAASRCRRESRHDGLGQRPALRGLRQPDADLVGRERDVGRPDPGQPAGEEAHRGRPRQ